MLAFSMIALQAQSEKLTKSDGQPCPGFTTATAIDSNIFNTSLINNQSWFLKTYYQFSHALTTNVMFLSIILLVSSISAVKAT